MLCVGDDEGDTCKFIKELTRKYDIQYLGKPEKFLGMRVWYTERGIRLTLDTKTKDLLERFTMAGAHPTDTPAKEGMSDELYDNEIQRREGMVEEITDFPVREAVGSLLYIAIMVMPDICNPVREISRYLEHPTEVVVKAIKRIMRYLIGTQNCGLEYRFGQQGDVEGYVDASCAGDKHKRRSVSGYFIMANGSPIE